MFRGAFISQKRIISVTGTTQGGRRNMSRFRQGLTHAPCTAMTTSVAASSTADADNPPQNTRKNSQGRCHFCSMLISVWAESSVVPAIMA